MSKYQHHVDTEKQIMDYLEKKSGNRTIDGMSFRSCIIAKDLKLSLNEVETALYELIDEKPPKVQQFKSNFFAWIPVSDNGDKVKDALLKERVVTSSSTSFIFALPLIIGFYFLLEYLIKIKGIMLSNLQDYYIWITILTSLSIWLARWILHKWFMLSYYLERVPGYKWLTALVIFLIITVIIFIKNGVDVFFGISIVANVVTIVGFIISIYQLKSKKKK